jgi:hypothetical protein
MFRSGVNVPHVHGNGRVSHELFESRKVHPGHSLSDEHIPFIYVHIFIVSVWVGFTSGGASRLNLI